MGKRNKSNLVLRGTASVSAFLLAFTSFGSVCAESYASQVNSFLGVKTSKMVSNSDSTDTTAAYPSSYGDFTEENLKKLEADVYDHIQREEEEGAVLLSNDGTLPLTTGGKVSLFGFAAYNPLYHTSAAGSRTYKNGDLTVDFYEALSNEGFQVNDILYNAYSSMAPRTGEGGFPPWGDGIKNYMGTGNCEAPKSIYTDEVMDSLDIITMQQLLCSPEKQVKVVICRSVK